MNNRTLLILLFIALMLSVSFAEMHCWRQTKDRAIALSNLYTFTESYSDNIVGLIVPTNSILKVSGFGNYTYQCEDGASGQSNNYIEIYDNLTGAVVKTNGTLGTGGPVSVGTTKMCMMVGSDDACYIENGIRYPGKGECRKGSFNVGAGVQDTIEVPMTSFKGEQDWTIRLGEISPAADGIIAGSPQITFRDLNRIKFTVDSSKPALLIFPPTPLQKLNSYDFDGNMEKVVNFTILNKSRVPSIINSYSVDCPSGVTCELDQINGANMYAGWKVASNQAFMIEVRYKFNKNIIPTSFASLLTVKFTPSGFADCPIEGCTASSTPLKFEAGLLDEQKFQINVINQTEQKYCVDYDGHLGRTGSDYAPRINLYFGGNVIPSSSGQDLISLNECSPLNYSSSQPNPDWVYCTQNEFLTSLAGRIGLYAENMRAIDSAEENGDFVRGASYRTENGKLKEFYVYLREQDLNQGSRNASIQEMLAALSDVSAVKIGFEHGLVTNKEQLVNLVDGMNLFKSLHGVLINDTKISPGYYKVILDLNDTGIQDLGGLFYNENMLNPNMNVKIYFEKVSDPKLDWFFYYIKDNYADSVFLPQTGADAFTTNYLDRGTIMNFEKRGDNTNLTKFYSTFAIPLIGKIVDQGEGNGSDSSFVLSGDEFKNKELFTVWTGFASSIGAGCGTTIINPKEGKKALPYRILDSNLGGTEYEITDLNRVTPNSVMYVETVVYLPTTFTEFDMNSPFTVFSLSGNTNSNKSLFVGLTNYTNYKIDSLENILQGIKDQNICMYYDNSTDKETWKLFWNQDKVLDSLKAIVKPQITDATVCESRELLSS